MAEVLFSWHWDSILNMEREVWAPFLTCWLLLIGLLLATFPDKKENKFWESNFVPFIRHNSTLILSYIYKICKFLYISLKFPTMPRIVTLLWLARRCSHARKQSVLSRSLESFCPPVCPCNNSYFTTTVSRSVNPLSNSEFFLLSNRPFLLLFCIEKFSFILFLNSEIFRVTLLFQLKDFLWAIQSPWQVVCWEFSKIRTGVAVFSLIWQKKEESEMSSILNTFFAITAWVTFHCWW